MAVPFAPAFIAGDAKAEPFLPREFASKERRIEAVQRAVAFGRPAGHLVQRRRAVSSLLKATVTDFTQPTDDGTGERSDRAAAVITGQQAGLFLGPLYTLYKAATAIVVARQLQAESGVRCIPVFWLQTEDHDFAEVDHCEILDGESAPLQLRLDAEPGNERQSIAHRKLGPGIDRVHRALREALDGLPHFRELELVLGGYRATARLGWAMGATLKQIFGDELVIFDPRDQQLAQSIAPLHQRALKEEEAISGALSRRAEELEAAGFECQVPVREGSPLSFFHPDGPLGPRYRLNRTSTGWTLAGREQSFTTEQLVERLGEDPLCFSTSALLRPIVQDALFATAAYVGGPGEASYFAQLAPLYRHFGLPMPMFVPRARFRLIDPRTRRLLDELKLTAAEAEAPREALLHKLVKPTSGPAPEALQAEVIAASEQVLRQLDSNENEEVRDALKRTRATIARAAQRLSHRYKRTISIADQITTDRVDRLQRVLYPHGQPQERVLGFASFAAYAGIGALKRALFAALEPFGTSIKDVQL